MSSNPIILPVAPESSTLRSPLRAALIDRWRKDLLFKIGVVLVVLLVLMAVLAPLIAPGDPRRGDLANDYLAEPGSRFIFGADAQGRDVFSRVLYGARISLMVGLISQCVAVTLGVTLGMLAGYYRRSVDLVVMRLADVTLAFPSLLLLIAVAAAVRPSLPLTFVVIGVVGWAGCRPTGAGAGAGAWPQRVRWKSPQACPRRARDRWIMVRHLLPNVGAAVIIMATLGIAGAIMAEARSPSWGWAHSRPRRAGARW